MKTAFTLFLYLTILTPVFAQDSLVSFKIQNHKEEPVASASIRITNRVDTMMGFSIVVNASGEAIYKIPDGQYIIHVSAINYQPIEKGITVSPAARNFIFTMEPVSKSLREVVVTTSKPLMRQEDDKTIIDPEALVSTSTTGYEVIEKTPGLFVDQDGNIYISSLSPASVQINGRELKMSASDIATLLKSLPPNAITRIEIVRTPSAKYDASGTGGIVNVVLRKGVKIGLTGSVNTGWQQGVYANNFLGLSLNNNNGSRNSYLNLNISQRNSYERILTDRIIMTDSALIQDALTKYPGKTAFAGYGLGFEWKEKWELNYDGRTSLNDFNNYTNSSGRISSISTGDFKTSNLNEIWNNGISLTNNNGLGLKYKIDTMGSEWTSDASITYSYNDNDQNFRTFFYTPPYQEGSGDGQAENRRTFLTAQSDLKKKYKQQWTVETGIKTSKLWFKNNAEYFLEQDGIRFRDLARTNSFRYKENINAFYFQASKTIRSIIIKGGGRLENTNMVGRQVVPGDTSFTIHRTDLFPYVYISRKVMSIAGYELRGYLVYRRSIVRPVYEQLNPYPRYVNEYMTEVGNPAVRPEFTTNYEFNISVDERPIFALGVNKTKDFFTTVVYQSDTSEVQTYRTTDNLGRKKEWYFRALGAIPPGKKYFFVVGTQYNHNFYQGLYANQPLSYKRGSWTFFTYHSLKIDKLSQFSLHGFMRLKGQQQFYELGSFGSLYASINRQFYKQKLIVTLSMSDIFGTNKNDFTINQGVVNAKGTRSADTRRLGINLRYNFGIRKKEENNNYLNIDPERSN